MSFWGHFGVPGRPGNIVEKEGALFEPLGPQNVDFLAPVGTPEAYFFEIFCKKLGLNFKQISDDVFSSFFCAPGPPSGLKIL